MLVFGFNEAIDPRALLPVPTTTDWREVRERDDNGALMAPMPPVANEASEERPTGRHYHDAAKLREARKLAKRNGMVRP